jgi:hypothetical protein
MAMIGLSRNGYSNLVKTVFEAVDGEISGKERDENIISILKEEEIHIGNRVRIMCDNDSDDKTYIGKEGTVTHFNGIQNKMQKKMHGVLNEMYPIRLDCGDNVLCHYSEIIKVNQGE